MIDPFTLALLGSAIGGLTNKKNPLKGALLGGGLGYGGGLLAAPAASTAGATSMGYLNPITGATSATPGFGLGAAKTLAPPSSFQSFMGVAKPVGEAAMAANAVNGLLGGQQGIQPSPITPPQPNGNLNEIVSGNNQQSQMFQQQSEQERARRMALLARMGGRNYGTS